MKQNNKTHILIRYGIITLGLLIFSALVVFKLFETTIVEAHNWNKRAKEEMSKVQTILPERGNILASNGSILACNITTYDIKIDLRHNRFEGVRIPMESVDSLADSLDVYYPRKKDLLSMPQDSIKKYSWHTKLKQELEKPFKKRSRALMICKKGTPEDFEKIRWMPYLRTFKGSGQRIPVYQTKRIVRDYPFGRMAFRSIGRVGEVPVNPKDPKCKETEVRGYSGLEKDLDSLLYGKPGISKKVTLTRGLGDWVIQPPKRGYDILTTIDIDMQDILEEELEAVCDSASAEWGTAILMEVATGEIKAISSLQRFDDGSYGESLNLAVLPFEPGSVMKSISMMIAFEDGLVKSVNDVVDCSPFQQTKDPHAPPVKNMKQVIEMSSNTGIARVIFRKYADKPETFYDRLAQIGFFTHFHSGIAGEQIPVVRRLVDKDSRGNNITMTARHLDLARQAYGYNTMIPPIYTLAYYNAIANDGVFRRPHLVRALRDESGRDSVLDPRIPGLPDRVCSPQTARKVRECIREVVWGKHGTARAVQDDRVEIAGKTGTAYPVEKGIGYNLSKRRYAFASFFPFDSPRYSCIVLILAPAGNSANRTSGQVVKNVATKLYSRGMLDTRTTFTAEKAVSTPIVYSSDSRQRTSLGRELGVRSMKTFRRPDASSGSGLPDLRGLDSRTAVATLEKLGYKARIQGVGRVAAQSEPPGSAPPKNKSILLTLRQ